MFDLRLPLTHWGREMHICVGKLTTIGSDNGLSPGRRQAIIWTNDGILLIGPQGTNFNEISIEIHTFLFKKFVNVFWKMASILSRPQCVNEIFAGDGISDGCAVSTKQAKYGQITKWIYQGHLLLTWIDCNPSMDK